MSNKKAENARLREQFPGYIKPSDLIISEIWKSALIIFDANVLLNLYRYSVGTRGALLDLLTKHKHRIWTPHQACFEFLRKRVDVILEQEKSYKSAKTELENISKRFESERAHPFLSEPLAKKLNTMVGEIVEHLDGEAESYKNLVSKDPILDRVELVIGGRVGGGFSREEKDTIAKEGEVRYKRHIPPGFKDDSKSTDGDIYRPYADLIIWKEIVLKSKTDSRDVIFVSDDQKEDWWLMKSGNTLGPRPELVAEFVEETGQRFLMYKPHRFLSQANKNIGGRLDERVIQETRVQRPNLRVSIAEKDERNLWREIQVVEREVSKCESCIFDIESKMEECAESVGTNGSAAREQIARLSEKLSIYKKRHSGLMQLLGSLEKRRLDHEDAELLSTIAGDP
ncbi:PIN-like domain-containing protein [Actomonas aquatica]|uniref:PIN-like domain-containing protein n=1 Tax=Actomonas aquatica TaxID=2866162 RepID=A0ABZ1C1U9_9BACT|nr:PIN-like domain-containing protein [Opitutus sp. WL0086]WRQ85617.1 PIN-like domain-containing protein [Opitutus sp. WL0086]